MSLCWGWAQQEGLGVWARPGVWRSQRGEEAAEVHEGPGLSGFGQCPGILPSAENAAQSAGLGPDQTLTPGVSTSGLEGFGHPCAHTCPRVLWAPELTPQVAHSLGQGRAPGRLPRLLRKYCRWQESETGPSHCPAGLEAQTWPQKGLQWPLVTRSPACPAPQTAARGNPPAKGLTQSVLSQSVLSHHMLTVRPQ